MTSYGLDNREEVHELEFLGLLAFLAREIVGLRGIVSPKAGKRFSPKDLEMAYALHNKQGKRGGLRVHSSPPRPPQEDLMGVGSRHVSPRAYPPPPPSVPGFQLPASPKHQSVMMPDSHQVLLPPPQQHQLQQQDQGRGFGVNLQKETEKWQNQSSPRRVEFDRGSSQSPPHQNSALAGMSESARYYQQLQDEHPVRQSAMLGGGPLSPPDAVRQSMLSEPPRDSRPMSMLEPHARSGPVSPLQLRPDNQHLVTGLGGGLMGSVRVQGPTLGAFQTGRQAQELSGI